MRQLGPIAPLEPPELPEWECCECGRLFVGPYADEFGEETSHTVIRNGRRVPCGTRWIVCYRCLEQEANHEADLGRADD